MKRFRDALADRAPPAQWPVPLRALWHAARGEWVTGHDLVAGIQSREAAWVHAHLHRIEGDLGNAAYWYRRAGRPVSAAPLAEEREEIAGALLGPPPQG